PTESMSAAVTVALLFFLSVALNEQVTEGCTCLPRHPQQHFCTSDIGTSNTCIANLTPTDKKRIQGIYTRTTPNFCGISLYNDEYLLSGRITPEGFFVSLCDYFEVWDKLSLLQKENLKYRYLTGCTCMISTCIEKPCQPSTKNECMQTDWSFTWQFKDGESVHESACIRHSDGSCGWYEGTAQEWFLTVKEAA
uniref:TIMP metallopeptidase inhibitor 4, tandem duplicate 1 n=1 Tax=Cyprinus carpio TaxID=7962 RepID=A0A8C1PIT1_CYPCA